MDGGKEGLVSSLGLGFSSGSGSGFGCGLGSGSGAGLRSGLRFGMGSILISLSPDKLDELELSALRLLGLKGFVECQTSSMAGKAPGALQGDSGCRGLGDGGGIIRS